MTTIQDKAWQYCVDMNYIHPDDKERSLECETAIAAYVKGYEQARKDLELFWRDVQRIVQIADNLCNNLEYDKIRDMGEQGYYTEILNRFNNEKEG